ncbi:MAG: hypothetical protein AXW17_13205 [Colwellia sp. Phe_37]|nr:MAG: hypothetical protein AXW17_13205 [Colwellia sp. Phe_37]
MNIQNKQFSIEELSDLTGLPIRTIRYYIQNDLVAKPEGEKRGSHYLFKHLNQLIEIQKWQKAGLSLERIKEILTEPDSSGVMPPEKKKVAGEISVVSKIYIKEGVEIQIDPLKANLQPEQVREFTRGILTLLTEIKNTRRSDD